jgi:hypothetical protein
MAASQFLGERSKMLEKTPEKIRLFGLPGIQRGID